MNELTESHLQSIKETFSSEIIYVIELYKYKLSLIEFVGDRNYFDSVKKLSVNFSPKEVAKTFKSIFKQNNYSTVFIELFGNSNADYLFLSAGKKEFPDMELLNNEFQKMSKLLLDQIIENNSNSLANSDYFPLFAESTNDIVFVLNEQGKLIFSNAAFQNHIHYSDEEIVGMHFFDIIDENSKSIVVESFQKIISTKTTVRLEINIYPKIGVEQLFGISLAPIFKDGKLHSLLGIGSNLSNSVAEKNKIKKLQSKLTEALRINEIERDRAQQQISVLNELNNLKNEFISNVSHELRTPLASIIGFAETIADDKNLTVHKAEEFNEVILSESKRLAKLINDVLDFSELESEKQKLNKNSVNIIDIINESVLGIKNDCEDKKITLTQKIPQSEIIVYADEERIKKVFTYLLSNAIKFTNELGRITVFTQEFLKEVEIVISDTGIGIPEQNIPLLFDKFSKVKRIGQNYTGAGFGLVTIKQIIDLHKGLIVVKSKVNKGTSFIIRLPKYSFN